MKKIVSLALSTAMALSMFASVSSAATMTTQEKYDALVTQGIFAGYPNGQAYLDKDMTRAEFAKVVALLTNLDTTATGTNTYQDKNYANAWYKSYVEAVTKAGYMKGTTTGAKKLFNPNGKVTVQEMAATLVRAAKLEIPTTGINNTASAWAKGEVQAAINAGLVSGTANFTAAATRGLLVDTAYAYQTAVVKPAVTSYEVTDNGATVVFTLVNGEKVTVKPATALKANVATTVTFTYAGKEYSESVTWKVTSATAATAAAATNLKEVEVTFNGEVNAMTAEDASKYSIASLPSDAIESAELLESKNVVRLTLKNGVKFVNQNDYTVAVTGVTGGTTTIPTASLTFRPLDNVLPTVQSVKGLGTKAIKVTFSEPIDVVNSNNFQVNGVAYVGAVTKAGNDREVILRPYTAFPVGTHTLTSSLVTDYAGLKSMSATNEFTVAVDTEGPTVTEIQATLEKAVVTFSEDIDPNTVARTDFYWVSGTTNHYADSVKQLAGNKFELTFGANQADRLPAAATTLFVDSVSDYSGNVNTVKQFTVNATVDQTRPVVTDVKFNANGTNTDTVAVKFSKKIKQPAVGSFVVTNSSGKVQPIERITLDATGTTATLQFVTPNLSSGSYTLNISGVRDNTLLENVMEAYKTTFSVGDTTRPKVSGEVYGVNPVNANSTITVSFNEAMDPTTLSDPNNYLLTLANGGGQVRLPNTSNIRIANDYKSVVITLPSTINNQSVRVGTGTAPTTTYVTDISLVGLEDAGDNLIEGAGTALEIKINSSAVVTGVKQTGETTVEVTFNQAIENASAGAFTVTGATISGITVSGNTVTLTTNDLGTAGSVSVQVTDATRIQTVSGVPAATTTPAMNAADAVAPKVPTTVTSLVYNAGGIQLPFSESLSTANQARIADDLIVIDTVSGDRVAPEKYDTTVVGTGVNTYVNIALDADVAGRQFSVAIRDKAVYLKDANGNVAAAQGPFVTRAFQ